MSDNTYYVYFFAKNGIPLTKQALTRTNRRSADLASLVIPVRRNPAQLSYLSPTYPHPPITLSPTYHHLIPTSRSHLEPWFRPPI